MVALERSIVRGAPLGETAAVRVEEHRDGRGSIRLWQHPGRRVYSTRVVGHLSIGLAQRIIDYVDPMFEQGKVVGFHDWFQMTGYDTASRS